MKCVQCMYKFVSYTCSPSPVKALFGLEEERRKRKGNSFQWNHLLSDPFGTKEIFMFLCFSCENELIPLKILYKYCGIS